MDNEPQEIQTDQCFEEEFMITTDDFFDLLMEQ